jgi:hypothetical protein
MAALAAARDELLSAADLVPDGQAASYPICGRWTLKDVLGHIADWEWFGVEGLGRMVREQECEIEAVVDIDAWNRVHVQARRDQPWAAVRADVDAAREALLDLLGAMKEEDLARVFAFPWGSQGSAYEWIAVYLAHDREHAQGLRAELGQESTGEGS